MSVTRIRWLKIFIPTDEQVGSHLVTCTHDQEMFEELYRRRFLLNENGRRSGDGTWNPIPIDNINRGSSSRSSCSSRPYSVLRLRTFRGRQKSRCFKFFFFQNLDVPDLPSPFLICTSDSIFDLRMIYCDFKGRSRYR